MFDKLLSKSDWILGVIFVATIVVLGYGLGSESKSNKLCKQLGGVYVQTWSDGYTCIMTTEIPLK